MCASGLDGHHEVNYGGRGAAWISWMEGIRVERAHYYCHTSRASCFPKFTSCPQHNTTAPPGSKKADNDTVGQPTHTTEANVSPNSRRCSVLSELSTYVSCNVQALVIRVGGAGSGGGGGGGGGGSGSGCSGGGGGRISAGWG